MDTRRLAELVGERVRELRGDRSQDALADAARRAGLDWTRASVASLETGRRGLSAEELVLLPTAVSILTGTAWRLVDLLPDGEDVYVETSTGARVGTWAMRELLTGVNVDAAGLVPPQARRVRTRDLDAAGEAERHAAKMLGTAPEAIAEASHEAWGRTLTAERDARAAQRAGEDASRRSLQAVRGHVTRELLDELEPLVGREG